ncbi:hypothetical protein T05_14979 [Trichinella murrelli]|uniref:Uncharacterized protein n=1 Tax=Trichinella murrelli TaxID=144512 RepID=A0A0V0TCS7_9BILA|nr:hypothetical protein T05_14979 [Trichinella murrelli]
MKVKEDLEKKPQATPQAMLQAKYLPSGYARGYASGKFFIICENFRDFQKYSRGLCPRLRFRQFLNKYSPSGYAAGYFWKKFCLQAMPRGKFKKYLPSGYAWGYASGKIFINRENFRDF